MAQRSEQNEIDKLRASTDEEIDALEVNLLQDGDEAVDDDANLDVDGTGRIGDDLARERIEAITEVGEDYGDRGAVSVTPGRDDTSRVMRRHNPDNTVAEIEPVVEGSIDEPRNEEFGERKIDEDTAA
ncbi:hypothetical protein DYQ86_13300 [Acidobacteria bacterium AB60]|nr:hypothetical protein DYQ86_13300 [Acidobacteria bacterium AB60]